VTYEALATSLPDAVDRVLLRLGVGGAALPDAPLRRQADERSEEWARRYRRERNAEVPA
jgi:LPS sulfotransferase NodH